MSLPGRPKGEHRSAEHEGPRVSNTPRRIGLFGGSFDPIHMAHLVLARTAYDHLKLDELRFVPAGRPWQKERTLTDGSMRAAMVKLAITGQRGFVVDSREVERPGPSYTIDTVRELQAELPDATFFLIIGQDQYEGIATWHEWRELLARVTLAVAGRGETLSTTPAALRGVWYRVEPLPMPAMDISSTAIREHLEHGGHAWPLAPERIPTVVARYIERNRLYGPFIPNTP
jgi:nicotinate-nucleotide adenylyltransferase